MTVTYRQCGVLLCSLCFDILWLWFMHALLFVSKSVGNATLVLYHARKYLSMYEFSMRYLTRIVGKMAVWLAFLISLRGVQFICLVIPLVHMLVKLSRLKKL